MKPSYEPESPFDSDPQFALEAIKSFTGPVLVDLDETLFLRNSTEEFINCAAPGLLALIMMRILDVIKPWRWSGGPATRDVWRVSFVMLLFPWTILIWKHRVSTLGQEYINDALAKSLKAAVRQPIIVTVGFSSIVKPLIIAMGFGHVKIVSARLRFGDRRKGKLAMANAALGAEIVPQSLLITDSIDDLLVLEACAKPLRVLWATAYYRHALTRVYLPGQYIAQVKRPGERYILRGILQEDFAFWILSSLALALHPLLHIVGLSFLLLSFWSIYERGYVDNDLVAEHFETAPKLSANYRTVVVATPVWQPWVWAMASAIIAILFLRYPNSPTITDFIKWFGLLIGTYAWFRLYNRYDKATRIWMFSILQFVRGSAFLLLVSCEVIGIAAVGAHILARWIPYFVYRIGGKTWPDSPTQTVRLLFFILLSTLFAMALGIATILNWTAIALLGWNIFRARKELSAIIRSAMRIDVTE